jgi:NAD(P)-dependent dehydrogenase (short-subunit alcohol dehydrogenase family)
MIRNGQGGSIINISSAAAVRPMDMLTVYCMSKVAISHMTKVLALEWGEIRHQGQRHCTGISGDAR